MIPIFGKHKQQKCYYLFQKTHNTSFYFKFKQQISPIFFSISNWYVQKKNYITYRPKIAPPKWQFVVP